MHVRGFACLLSSFLFSLVVAIRQVGMSNNRVNMRCFIGRVLKILMYVLRWCHPHAASAHTNP